eukprot:CAMPEP_0116146902 /NCGR_PEP_ID=MMETSP0329-20121206/17432_1 /TAXON_ID=697910 /ORGANISM="Pseudo-nitzschia arenysensis, Strain B593" /LENGTH=134 /DNA_ID=CAMNT_0003642721 /DNA_START=8 /DNA_END=412 /DNA_ORIENTATION=+
MMPTKKPSCEDFTVEVRTDDFPGDTSWEILDPSGSKKFSRDAFSNKRTVYKDEICLDTGADYKFVMLDSHGDGICCTYGNGYYKVKDGSGKVVVDGATGSFHKKEHMIPIGDTPRIECVDKKGRFKWKQQVSNL